MSEFLHGVSHPGQNAFAELHNAGIGTIRMDIPFPFDGPDGSLSSSLRSVTEWVATVRSNDMNIIGITPYPSAVPTWGGEVGSSEWYGTLRNACKFLAEHFGEDIPIWQCTNEMNIAAFRAPLDVPQSLEFVRESARGLKDSAIELMVGANMGGFNTLAEQMYGDLYAPTPDSGAGTPIAWDYVGADGYFGTWEPGGPHTWHVVLDKLAEISPLPVIAMEWGFSSAGEIMAPENVVEGNTDPHEDRKWCYGWDRGGVLRPHTPEMQARYIEETVKILRERTIGSIYYCMRDSKTCSCGSDECPVESNWGLLNSRGETKPSYFSLRRMINSFEKK
jgi:hypothetical protein